MDPALFYGRQNVGVKCHIDGNVSEDPDLSDEENLENFEGTRPVTELLAEQIEDSDGFDSDDDNVPLAELFNLKPKHGISKECIDKSTISWEDNFLSKDVDTAFLGDTELPPEITKLNTPTEMFQYLFPRHILTHIVDQSVLYSRELNVEKPILITEDDIEQFMGVVMYMSLIHLPSTRDYWGEKLGQPLIMRVMTVNRFEEIKRCLHFNDNSTYVEKGQPGHDNLHKIRPLFTMLKERLALVPKEKQLCVDEQIIPFKGRTQLKQYNPKKPHKWGYKVFVLSGVSGFSYDIELFTGAGDNTLLSNEADLGVSSNVVIRLARSIPRYKNHQLYFDNWFNSLQLQVYLAKNGILSLGTVRRNRLKGCELPLEKEFKNLGRGTYKEKTCLIDNVRLSATAWFDNRIVHLLSTFVGSQPECEVKRYFAKEKKHKMVTCPQIVKVYNEHMGGVDLVDSMLGYYRILIRSKKWYLKIFFHLIDLTVVNAWLLYRRATKLYMPLKDFKLLLAESLCHEKKDCTRTRGRPSAALQSQSATKKSRAESLPCKDVRLDKFAHFPVWNQDRQRCKFSNCNGFSYVSCKKCNVTLCFNRNKNCFLEFHSN